MSQRLLTLLNKPVLANLHLRDLLLFSLAAVLTYSFFVYAPISSLCQGNASVPSKKAFVVVVNGKGEWIIPPRYLQIIYMRKTDTFWVKVRESDVSSWWMPDALHWVGRNTAWKLLDRNGVERVSHLPYLAEPVCAEMADFGASIHPDMLVVKKNWEYGYCEPDGRPITGCHYSFLHDAGNGIWIGRETQQTLGEDQMPLVLLDHKGRKIRTLDETINYRHYAANGWVECWHQGQWGYVDYRGEFIPVVGNLRTSGEWGTPATRRDQTVVFKYLVGCPKSLTEPVKWIDLAKHTEMSRYVITVPLVDNRAVISVAGKYGLVDINGNWLLQPTFNGLLYCDKDTLIAHQKQRTAEEIQIERYEHCGSLTGF